MASATTLTSNPSGVLQPTPASGTQYPSSSTSASSGSNELDPNSFITLLTAQLQAQDPLNPMDPSQMVDQLTQINSLQQLIQIQSDLQTLVGSSSSGTQTAAAQSNATPSGTQTAAPANSSPSTTLASNQ